jgi:hypothetical protein
MLILVLMLVIGLFAAIWGFLMCFLPTQWDRLTEAISFAPHWTQPSTKRLNPATRFVNRIAGLAIFGVGSWFTYFAVSEIYLVLMRHAAITPAAPISGTTARQPMPLAIVALSAFVIAAGVLMALFPAQAITVLERVWPSGRSMKPSAAPKVNLFVRLCGIFFAFLAMMSLIRYIGG